MKKHSLFLVLALSCLSTISHAQSGAIATSTAGTGRAAVETNEAPSLNPASIPFSHGYFFATDYSFLNEGHQFEVALTDNLRDTIVPTSLIYNQTISRTADKQDFSAQRGQLEFANFYEKSFSVGVGARYEVDETSLKRWTQTNVIIGGLWAITPNFSAALTAENLLTPDATVPFANRLMPTTSAGINYIYKRMLRARLDVISDNGNSLQTPTIAGGIEAYMNRWLVVRTGVNKNYETRLDGVGGGLGFMGPKFAVNYGYYSSPEDDKQNRHAIDLAVPIW